MRVDFTKYFLVEEIFVFSTVRDESNFFHTLIRENNLTKVFCKEKEKQTEFTHFDIKS